MELLLVSAAGVAFAARPFLASLVVLVCSGSPLWLDAGAFGLASVEAVVLFRLRSFWDEVPKWLRALGHAGLCAAVLALTSKAPVGIAGAALLAFLFALEWSRSRGQLLVFDPGGALSLSMLLGATEVVFTVAASVLAVFLPRVALALTVMVAVGAVLSAILRWGWERAAEVLCEQCAKPVHACARFCSHCGQERAHPRVALWTGRPGSSEQRSVVHQRMSLTAAGRCGRCAAVCSGGLRATCAACQAPRLDADEAQQVLRDFDARLPVTLAICAAISAVPVAGLLVGAVYFRLSRNGALGRFVPLTGRLAGKTVLLFATIGLGLLQSVPVVGIASVPLLAALTYAMDRRAVAARMAV
jgi:hypothetical protein